MNIATPLLILTITLIIVKTNCVTFNEITYSYQYEVDEPKFGIITHHWERRQGNQVQGGYSLLDADGKVRVVEYHVDGNRGFNAFVTFRRPPGQFQGHLQFPKQYRTPVRLSEPVSLITPDLLKAKKSYPNLPRY